MSYFARRLELLNQLNRLWPELKTPGLTDEERDEIILEMIPIWNAPAALGEETSKSLPPHPLPPFSTVLGLESSDLERTTRSSESVRSD
jgi:hypothetical protein